MKVILEIKESKAMHLLEVLKGLSFVKIRTISDKKLEMLENISEAVNELNQIRKGKLKGIPAKDLADEL